MRVYTRPTPAPGHHFTLQSNRGKRAAEKKRQYLIKFDKVKSISCQKRFTIIMINVVCYNLSKKQ